MDGDLVEKASSHFKVQGRFGVQTFLHVSDSPNINLFVRVVEAEDFLWGMNFDIIDLNLSFFEKIECVCITDA